jgi:hypothetical protein
MDEQLKDSQLSLEIPLPTNIQQDKTVLPETNINNEQILSNIENVKQETTVLSETNIDQVSLSINNNNTTISVPLNNATIIPDNPIFIVVKDIIFSLIFSIPALRSKLTSLLDNSNLALQQILTIYNELKSKISENDLDKLKQYVCQESTRGSLTTILQTAFTNIMLDGKIDMNDSNHFLQLMYDIIILFNQENSLKQFNFTLSSDVIIFFLYFLIKCTLTLTLDNEEETNALLLLDGSFKLISIAVIPITKLKCSINPFSCCMKKNK